jgi:signal transduction histidine kinase
MHIPAAVPPRGTNPKREAGPNTHRFSGKFKNAGVEAHFRAESESVFLRHDRYTIALIFALEAIFLVIDLLKLLDVQELNALRIGLRALFMMTLVAAFFHCFSNGREPRGTQGFVLFSMAVNNLLIATYHHPYFTEHLTLDLLLAVYMVTVAVYYAFLSARLEGTVLMSVALGLQFMVLRWWFDAPDLDQIYAPILLFGLIALSHYARVGQAHLHRVTWLRGESERHQQLRAEEIQVFRDHLLKLVGHDLRQPLGALRYYSAAVRIGAANLGVDEAHRSLLMAEQINLALDQVTEMLDKALELALLDNNSVVVRCRKQPIAPLAKRLRENFAGAAAIAGVEIRIHGSGRAVVHDPALMLPVLRNLVSNALQYHDHNTSRPRVVVAFRGKLGDRIDIVDNGGGFSAKLLDNGVQASPRQEVNTHSGLGLTIARHFAQKQGWQMEVTSSPGRGTYMRLHLPSGSVSPSRDQAVDKPTK